MVERLSDKTRLISRAPVYLFFKAKKGNLFFKGLSSNIDVHLLSCNQDRDDYYNNNLVDNFYSYL